MSSSLTSGWRARRIAEEAVEDALRRLLRGGTWQALTYELAWKAARAAGAAAEVVPTLAELLDARLASAIESLAAEVERTCAAAAAEHLREWPHDEPGADTAATLDGHAEAERLLGERYVELLEWAARLLDEGADRGRFELPAIVADRAGRERFGWPRRSAA